MELTTLHPNVDFDIAKVSEWDADETEDDDVEDDDDAEDDEGDGIEVD